MKKNVVILGEAGDLYRTQLFISCVLSRFNTVNVTYIASKIGPTNAGGLKKILNIICRKVDQIFRECFLIYQALYADVLYIPAMSYKPRLLRIACLLKKPIIAEFYISVYDTMVLDRKAYGEGSRSARKFMKYDRRLQERTHVIYLNQTEATRYAGLAGLTFNSLQRCIIPLSVKERSKANLAYYTTKNTLFNVVWWGTYIPLHGLERIIEAFSKVVKQDLDCRLHILGNSEAKSEPFKKMVQERGLEKYIIIRNDVSFSNGLLEKFLVDECSLSLGVFGDSEKSRSVIVNKAIEAVGMKIPVLTQHSEAFKEYFEQDREIFYCEATADDIAQNILNIKKLDNLKVQAIVASGHAKFQANFSLIAANNKYEALLNDTLK